MYTKNEQKFEEILLQLNLVSKEQVDLLKIESARSGRPITDVISDMNMVKDEDLTKAFAISMGLAYVDLSTFHVDPKILSTLPKEMAKKFMSVPFAMTENGINLATMDPNNVEMINYIEKRTGKTVTPYMASADSINNIIDQYQDYSQEITEAIGEIDKNDLEFASGQATDQFSGNDINNMVADAPVSRALNTILEYAVKSRASDIHLEPRAKSLKVRYRIDGVLREVMTLPAHIHLALISRIKIQSNLKIDEHRIPQDGRFGIKMDGKEIDLRIAILPTSLGEKVVIRLLYKNSELITLESLGIRGRSYKIIEAGSKKPHGMVLSTGPTGSGKSTTLYALLNKMNKPEVNIITLEDPVEYQIEGINQIQVNSAVGLTFAAGLRSILRQDPDIIMVGEIRDSETGSLAVQSALTGHTVLSTLHTNSAAGVLPRLLDMGIEPFLISSTLNTVIGQRLVRVVCEKCKKPYQASPALKNVIMKSVGQFLPKTADQDMKDFGYSNLPLADAETLTLYKGEGCEDCQHTGYSGRIGIYEVFPITSKMEELLQTHATSTEVEELAINEGMITMRQDGLLKALEGITTIDEVVSKTSDR